MEVTTATDEGTVVDTLVGVVDLIYAANYNITAYVDQRYEDISWEPDNILGVGVRDTAHYDEICTTNVTCISEDCADGYVSYELGTWKFIIEPLSLSFKGETHIYTVLVECDGTINRTDEATFKVSVYSLRSTYSPINIWLPSARYYKYFAKILPYRMIEPYDYNETASSASSGAITGNSSFQHEFKLSAPSEWTQTKTLQA